MAENQWGPKPVVKPPPSVFPAPAFWGPAEVPDQVRGQPRVDTWVNKDYSWEPPALQSVEGGPHDSWVSPVLDQGFLSEPGTPADPSTEGNFIADSRAQEGGAHDSYVAPVIDQNFESAPGTPADPSTEGNFIAGSRAQEGGDHDSWVAPVIDQDFPSAPGEGEQGETESNTAEHRSQEGGEHETWLAPIIDQNFESEAGVGSRYEGDHGSWVAPVLKQFFPSEPGEQAEHATEGRFVASNRPQEGTPANPLNPFVRLQGGGDADSWVDPVIEQTFLSKPGEATLFDGENETMLDPVIKQLFASEAGIGTTYGGENDTFVDGKVRMQYNDAPSTFVGGFIPDKTLGVKKDIPLDKYVGAWNFEVKIAKILETLNFISVSGINSESEPIQFKFGSDPFMRHMPGVAKFGDVEMTRIHQKGSVSLWQWRQKIENGIHDARNITVRLKHVDNATPVFSMTLHNCWPIRWDAPDMNAGGSDGALEKITFKVSWVTTEVGEASGMGLMNFLTGSNRDFNASLD